MTRAPEARMPARIGSVGERAGVPGFSGWLSSLVGATTSPPCATLLPANTGAAPARVLFLATGAGTPVAILPVGASARTGGGTVDEWKSWRGGAQEALVPKRPCCLTTPPHTDNGHRVPACLGWLGHSVTNLTPTGAARNSEIGIFGSNVLQHPEIRPAGRSCHSSGRGKGLAAD